jgi:hypothetical protein
MKSVYAESIAQAQALLAGSIDRSHDASHAYRVAYNVGQICQLAGYTDVELLVVCAWWHDVGRTYTGPNHEELSARMLWADLNARDVSEEVCRVAYEAVRFHRYDMQPRSLAGQIIKDADKLDFLDQGRWRQGLQAGEWESINTKVRLLPQLRNLLELPASRRLYDGWVGDFNVFLRERSLATG